MNGYELEQLAALVSGSERLLVLTGAGCSTESGIPAYRDEAGDWQQSRPVQHQDFLTDPAVRQRYWARSLIGWARMQAARPNAAHRALAELEKAGTVHHLITQNVDCLHQRAGSRRVIDLHGRLDSVECLGCRARFDRSEYQRRLEQRNPEARGLVAPAAPDGDARLEGYDHTAFGVPGCPRCGGIVKPSVVFFGDNVPRERVAQALQKLEEADALLVVGSSLMVFSGYRFVRAAAQRGIPTAAVNLGRTRADAELGLKVRAACGEVLPRVVSRIAAASPP